MVGPLPPADEFEKYQRVMPDFPERIVRQFEEDSANIRELRKAGQKGDIDFDRRSQWMAFVIIMSGLLGTLLLAYLDKDVAAVMTGAATAALIFKGVFSKDNGSKGK